MGMKENSFEQLSQRIDYLERLTRQLLQEKEQEVTLQYGWTHNLGHWYWDIKSNRVQCNSLKVTTLGYSMEEIPEHMDFHFFTDKLHPDDYEKTMNAMRDHLYGKADVYEVEYRIRTKSGGYKWYYDRGKITQYDEHKKPAFLAGIVFDITDQKERELELENCNEMLAIESRTDELTRLHNRRWLSEKLEFEMSRSKQTGNPLSVALFDIDNFKRINDSMGHVTGDKILSSIAELFRIHIRASDSAGRYGGEEFLLILPHTRVEEAVPIAERIRHAVEQNEFVNGLRVTISGGVMQYTGREASDAAFIHDVDTKLYKAKRQGKNRIVY